MKKILHFKRRVVENTRDVDICIRDAYGNEHLLFPNEKKEVVVIVEETNDRSRTN